MKTKRLTFYAGLIASVLLLFVLFAYQQLASARAAVLQSAEDLKTCQILAGRIESLQDLPAQAGLHQIQKTQLDKQMEAAALAHHGIHTNRIYAHHYFGEQVGEDCEPKFNR